MTPEAAEIMEKLKDKKAEYEAIASSDSSIHLEDIDNWIITEVLGPKRYGRAQAEVQRLKDQMAQMQVTTVEVQRKYEELQLQLKAEAAAREAEAAAREAEQSRKYNKLQQQLQNMMKMFQQSQHPP
ncbi:hypothetical protein Gotur_028217, partial [Gossypium turneri]